MGPRAVAPDMSLATSCPAASSAWRWGAVQQTSNNVTQTFLFTNGAGQTNALLWGYTVGAGLDWALTPNIFARGEFEFVQFAPITNIAVSVASGRVGAGFKF